MVLVSMVVALVCSGGVDCCVCCWFRWVLWWCMSGVSFIILSGCGCWFNASVG